MSTKKSSAREKCSHFLFTGMYLSDYPLIYLECCSTVQRVKLANNLARAGLSVLDCIRQSPNIEQKVEAFAVGATLCRFSCNIAVMRHWWSHCNNSGFCLRAALWSSLRIWIVARIFGGKPFALVYIYTFWSTKGFTMLEDIPLIY